MHTDQFWREAGSVGQRSAPLRTNDDPLREHRAGAVLHAPGSLSPRKLILKGRSLRQDLGTY
jgi:hypothetical protein